MSVRTTTTHAHLLPPAGEPTIEGWHFSLEGGQCGKDAKKYVRPGETMSVSGEIEPCKWGLHASERALDALRVAPIGPVITVSRVALWGDLAAHDGDKWAARRRRCIWQADATTALWLYACDEVDRVLLAEREAGREPHADTWAAVAVRRAWVAGNATDADVQAAYRAAYRAAYLAAYRAAYRAAYLAANERLERVLTALGPGGEA
jgi:hypothetical protein